MYDSDSEDDDIEIIVDEEKVFLACKNPLKLEEENKQLRNILDFVKYFIPQKVQSEVNKAELIAIINYCGNYDPDYVLQEVSRRCNALCNNGLSSEDYEYVKNRVILEQENCILRERIEKLRVAIRDLNESDEVKIYLIEALETAEGIYKLQDGVAQLRRNRQYLELETENLERAIQQFNIQNTAMGKAISNMLRQFNDNEVGFDLASDTDFPPLQ